jgi:stalled ribosome rescue protein Dom34
MNAEQHHFHLVIWLDHREARVIGFNAHDSSEESVHAHKTRGHWHHRAGVIGDGHGRDDKVFLDEIAKSTGEAGEILVMGPGQAKDALMRRLREHWPDIARRVMGVEASDHPTDAQIVAHARAFFTSADRMTPQRI